MIAIIASWLDNPNLPQTAMLAGLVLIIGAVMWSGARRRARQQQPERHAHRHAEEHNRRLEKQARADMDELMVRLEEVSREICGKIDTRFAKLEQVIADADQRLAALRTAVRRQAALSEESPAAEAPLDPRCQEICRRQREGQTVVAIARDMGLTAGEVELIISLERSRQADSRP